MENEYKDGWRVSNVEVEEFGSWKNRLSIDIECTEEEREAINQLSKYQQRINAMVYMYMDNRGVPTYVGHKSRLNRDWVDEEDLDLNIEVENVFLDWDRKYEVILRYGNRKYVQIPFKLENKFLKTNFPKIKDLELASEIRPVKWKRVPEVTGKVKVRFSYDFPENQDAWFKVHYDNVTRRWWERICRYNPRGKTAVWIPLKHGDNNAQIAPWNPDSGATGSIASIKINNPHKN